MKKIIHLSLTLLTLFTLASCSTGEAASKASETPAQSTKEKVPITLKVPTEIEADQNNHVSITGTTNPGAKVTIGSDILGDSVKADKKGKFTLEYELSGEDDAEITIQSKLEEESTKSKIIVKQNAKLVEKRIADNKAAEEKAAAEKAAAEKAAAEKAAAEKAAAEKAAADKAAAEKAAADKAAAEKAAAEKAAADKAAAEKAAQETTPPIANGQLVYIAPESGKRYHSTPNCRGLNNANSVKEISIDDVGPRTPCKWCH